MSANSRLLIMRLEAIPIRTSKPNQKFSPLRCSAPLDADFMREFSPMYLLLYCEYAAFFALNHV